MLARNETNFITMTTINGNVKLLLNDCCQLVLRAIAPLFFMRVLGRIVNGHDLIVTGFGRGR